MRTGLDHFLVSSFPLEIPKKHVSFLHIYVSEVSLCDNGTVII